jgi:hypothetical protein
MRKETLSFRTSNRILQTYKNFPYKPWYAIAELVDNSTQSFIANRKQLIEAFKAETAKKKTRTNALEVRIDYDAVNNVLSVWDNAMGMSKDELQHGILLANPPHDKSGRSEFGMGMKTACSWLGSQWSVETKKLGETERFKVSINVNSFGDKGEDQLDLLVTDKQPIDKHFTLIEIREMNHVFKGTRLHKIKEYLVDMYREDIRNGTLVIKWDSIPLEVKEVQPLTVTEDGVKRTWKRDISFKVHDKPVTGFACILGDGYRGRANAGFDLLRRGRIIVGRPGGYRPENIFGESRNDLKNQRLYGELNLNGFPVNHLKDDFLWEHFQDEFDDELQKQCADILAYLKTMKVKSGGVAPETQEMADDAVADELSSDKMVELIEFLTEANPPNELPNDAAKAEAASLRKLADSHKVTQSGRFTIRIYHLKKCAPERKYMTFVSDKPQNVDVFINDNHPFILREIAEDPVGYEAYVKTCVYDALAEWIARKIPNLSPNTISHYKDALMRGPGLESEGK